MSETGLVTKPAAWLMTMLNTPTVVLALVGTKPSIQFAALCHEPPEVFD